jgi:indole-3-glycerol phosphate synthase
VLGTVTDDAHLQVFGFITYRTAYDPVSLAVSFVRAGVDGLIMLNDVLVDGSLYTRGINDQTLVSNAVKPPLISSDYVLDEYHIVEARAAGVSAVTLRPRTVSHEGLRSLVSLAQRNRLTVIMHVHDEVELAGAMPLCPQVIALGGSSDDTFEGLEYLRAAVPTSTQVLLSRPLDTPDDVEWAVSLHPAAIVISERFLHMPGAGDALARVQNI